jgi:hypothetical protein
MGVCRGCLLVYDGNFITAGWKLGDVLTSCYIPDNNCDHGRHLTCCCQKHSQYTGLHKNHQRILTAKYMMFDHGINVTDYGAYTEL